MFEMSAEKLITNFINKNLGLLAGEISRIGKGASGSVYAVKCNEHTKTIAVKVSRHPELLFREFEMLSLLKQKTSSKIPEVYFFDKTEEIAVIAMEYIEGVSGADKSLKFRFGKKHLADSILGNLLLIQEAHNDKFGPYDNAVYDTWQQYYKEFADEIYGFAQLKHSEGELDDTVMKAIELSYNGFDKIFCEEIPAPTLIHGDYWMPNFIIDKKKMELCSVVDPFNVMWADPEYELFALTAGYGSKLHLYERYKSKVRVSKHCDVKLEMYALYSEMLWYKKDVPIEHEYLKKRSNMLIKQMKKHKII